MQQVEGRIVLSPTDLTKHLACAHVTTLDLAAMRSAGLRDGPDLPGAKGPDDALNLIFAKGLEHERDYLRSLRAPGVRIVEIQTRWDDQGRRAAEAETLEAMRAGVDVIYQATVYDGSWGGQADFLLRRPRPSALGPWSYDIADTKLARRLKVPALLQMATYAERLTTLQGVAPRELIVVIGDKAVRPWRLVDVAAFARRARARLRTALERPVATEAVPVPYCSQCRWIDRCRAGWESADDLSLVAGMRSGHRRLLRDSGLRTVLDLATAPADELPRTIGRSARERLAQQARLQVTERETGQPAYELLDPEQGRGLLRLPAPSAGDVYLDFEGDPWAAGGSGREYLAGLWDREGRFTAFWAHSFDEEAQLTRDLVDELARRCLADPGMHIYHYAAYERTALQRLTGRHGTREAELDVLLRGERLVDLYAVVRQGVRISKGSYSIKKLEDFYWGQTRHADGADAVADAMTSVVEYERYLLEGDTTILDALASYNRDDVRSTHDLQGWLEERRAELAPVHGPLPRPAPVDGGPSESLSDTERAESELSARLEGADQFLLAGLVGWHRRESRPAWWDMFRVEDLDEEGLVDDGSTIGLGTAARPPEHVGDIARSRLWQYTFEPQDCKLAVGKAACDVDTHQSVGTVHALDAVAGTITLKRSKSREPALPRGFGPPGPINTAMLQQSISRSAERILAGEWPLAAALLARRVPPSLAPEPGEHPRDAVLRVGRELHGAVLAVQGPPGSGKTTVGAELIRALLDDGLTVGVTAQSHAVIDHLLQAVGRSALHKGAADAAARSALVAHTDSNDEVAAALRSGDARLVGGTAWLWSRPDLQDSVDVLIIDEAGQFSLANAVAASSSAHSLVLLGDPQQLTQPTQAAHPHGAGVSTLEHLLDGHDTIPAGCGIFLDTTWRMHPEITAFVSGAFYDDRLGSAAGRDRQQVTLPAAPTGSATSLSGSGLRFIGVDHDGDASSSAAEATVVAAVIGDLLGGSWTDAQGLEHPMAPEDILVVAPYNAQVAVLRNAAPDRVRVGTVDRFQGQEAPVVIYSMASSAADLAPRGVHFLYDLHRLNVAISRARALAIVVASPRLLDAEVHTPEELRAVNALCLYAEIAAAG